MLVPEATVNVFKLTPDHEPPLMLVVPFTETFPKKQFVKLSGKTVDIDVAEIKQSSKLEPPAHVPPSVKVAEGKRMPLYDEFIDVVIVTDVTESPYTLLIVLSIAVFICRNVPEH